MANVIGSLAVMSMLLAPPSTVPGETIRIEPLGWTADGRTFAFRQIKSETCKLPGGICTWTYAVIRDAVSLSDEVHLVDARIVWEDFSPRPLLEAGWLETWTRSHPLTIIVGTTDGPRMASARSRDFEVASEGKTFRLTRREHDPEKSRGEVTLSVEGDPAGKIETQSALVTTATATL